MEQDALQARRRADYVGAGPLDRHIVALLAREIEATLRLCPARLGGGAVVLDVGCGRQPFRARLEAGGFRYVSIDLAQTPDGTVDFLGAIDDATLPGGLEAAGPFDLIFCTEVMEHVFDWTRAFANFDRLLTPGGRLLITCPFFYPIHEAPYDRWRATHFAMREMAERQGWAIDRLEGVGTGWDVIGTAIAAVGSPPGQRGLTTGFLRMAFRGVKAALLALSNHPGVRARLQLTSPFYMSNIALFRKPSVG